MLKRREDGPPKLVMSPVAANAIKHFEAVKWPDPRDETADRIEQDLPLDKFMKFPDAVSYVLAFLEDSSGVDFYGVRK